MGWRASRWSGQTHGDHTFSVAEHSLLVEAVARDLAPEHQAEHQLAAATPRRPEYVIGDLISPFKAALALDYRIRSAASVRDPSPLRAADRTTGEPPN